MRWLIVMFVGLSGCTTPVIKDRLVETKIAVSVPCLVGSKPEEVAPLRTKIDRDTWSVLTTDQRQKQLAAQAMDRKRFGDELTVVTVGCH